MDETAPATQASPAPRSIGQRLRAGRERAGLSMAAAAEKLHLDLKVIEALEADRFAELGASVYVRGHLRRFADFVGEPGAELVNLYTAREARPPPPDLTQIPQAEHRADPRRLVTPMVGLGCALVLAVAIWWVLAGSQSGGSTTTDPAPASETASVPAVAQAPANTLAAPVVQAAAVPAGSSVTPTPTAVTPPEPATAERREDTAPVRATQLTLQLTGESWVEIYDSRGERLFFDIASAGSVQSVQGRPPLRVVLGNAAAVAVQVNGQAREIPAAAVDGDGASFVVNRSGSLSRSRQ